MAHMEESKCFDAEAYYEECGLSKKLFNEDLRSNDITHIVGKK